MPRICQPKSLIDLGLLNIADNIDFRWLIDKNHSKATLYALCELNCLETVEDLMTRLLQILRAKNKLRGFHFLYLLNEHMKQLHISGWKGSGFSLFNPIKYRGYNLTSIDLSRCINITNRELHYLVTLMSKVHKLCLNSTNCDDLVMEAVKYCSHLTHLEIANTKVTDTGLHLLLPPIYKDMAVSILFRKAPEIQKELVPLRYLNAETMGISPIGLALALVAFTELKELLHMETLLAIQYVSHVVLPNELDQFRFKINTILTENIWDNFERTMLMASELCPIVTKLQFNNCDLSNFAFTNCQGFAHLDTLVMNFLKERITFITLEPLLMSHGHHIKHLSLDQVVNIDFALLGILCPNLEVLKLNRISLHDNVLPQEFDPPPGIYEKLKTFELVYDYDHLDGQAYFPDGLLYYVLKNAHSLNHFHVSLLESLSETILFKIFSHNPFSCIETVHFHFCPSVSNNLIRYLVTSSNLLKRLIFTSCEAISMNKVNQWNAYIRAHNLNCTLILNEHSKKRYN